MLVLNRKVGERVCIGGNVFVTVLARRGNQIRLGIEAPPSVPIRREELPALEEEECAEESDLMLAMAGACA